MTTEAGLAQELEMMERNLPALTGRERAVLLQSAAALYRRFALAAPASGAERAETANLRKAIELILPLAKGYAHAHPVGSNQDYVIFAEQALQSDSPPSPSPRGWEEANRNWTRHLESTIQAACELLGHDGEWKVYAGVTAPPPPDSGDLTQDLLALIRSLPAPSPSGATDAPTWVRVLIGKARSCLIKPGEPVQWLFTDEELLATAATVLSSAPAPAPSPSGKE